MLGDARNAAYGVRCLCLQSPISARTLTFWGPGVPARRGKKLTFDFEGGCRILMLRLAAAESD
eukprot:3939032-Pyramimonas_sp.AAC.1